jgi:maltooligosyltrehalose trehalohydrolase
MMNQPELKQRLLGVNFINGMTQVLLWAPFAKEVVFHNETTGAKFLLDQAAFGYWHLLSDEIRDDDLYRFSIDGAKPLPDPASVSQPSGVHGASQVVNLHTFSWTDQAWHNPDFGEYIIYELHTGTFTADGNFNGIAGKLDYLKELGINAIEIMPVAQFPGKRNWGYDGVFPFAVQESYGGAMALQDLVNTCHSKGFAVILDVVYNHLGPEGNYFSQYGPYFTDKYKTPWGSAINFDDEYCDPVRRFFIENALMWLRDFHIDALRLDAVHAIKDYSPRHIIKEMNDAVAMYNATTFSRKYLIAETDLNDSRYIKDTQHDGFGVRAQWCDEFHHSLRVAAGQAQTGYYADFDGLDDLAKSLKDAYVFTGQYSDHRHRNFGTLTTGISGDHFVVFAQNHDQVGNRMLGERLSQLVSFDMQKLMATMVLTAPFVPLLFMGEEWGATAPFLYFIDHSDKELIRAVDRGRKAEFAQFQTEGEPEPAHEEQTFFRSKPDWAELSRNQHQVIFAYYQQLIRMRKTIPALMNYERSSVKVAHDTAKGLLISHRSFEDQQLYCLFNFSTSLHEVRLRGDIFPLRVLLSSSDKQWLGKSDSPAAYNHQDIIRLLPESVIILASYNVST